MLVVAVIQWAAVIPLIIGIFGVAGIIFTALKFNRDDTTAIVTQQSTILGNMKDLNAELRVTADSLRNERDLLAQKVSHLSGQVEALSTELRAANEKLSSQMTEIHDRLDDGH